MTSLVVRRERSSSALRNTENPSLIIWSLEYLHPIFFFNFQQVFATFLETYSQIEFTHGLP